MKKDPRPVNGTDPRKLMAKVEKRFNRLSTEEKVKTLVDAGILTKGNKIRPPYRKALANI